MFSGYTKDQIDREKNETTGNIVALIFATIPFILLALPLLLYSCPYSSGINFCGSMYVKKLGTAVRTERENAGDACVLFVEYGFDGISNYTNLQNNTKKFYNYIGGNRCKVGATYNTQECSTCSCEQLLDFLQASYSIGSVNTIFFNKDHIEDGNSNMDKVQTRVVILSILTNEYRTLILIQFHSAEVPSLDRICFGYQLGSGYLVDSLA